MTVPVLQASGTQTATLTTEHFLYSPTPGVAGVFSFHIDLINMAAGDFLIVRVYTMVLTGGTARPTYTKTFQGLQPAEGFIPIGQNVGNNLTDNNSVRFSLLQSLGSAGRDYPWKVLSY